MDTQTIDDPEGLVAMDADPELEGSDGADVDLGDGMGCPPPGRWC